MKMISNKGQLKIQEMAFVLLALVLLGVIVFIFYARLQSQHLKSAAEELKQERALSLRDKIASLPEIKCSEKMCIDRDKAEIFKEYKNDNLFQGLAEVRIMQIYPEDKEMMLYSSHALNETFTRYHTFINICEQKRIGDIFNYECGLGILVIGIP